MHILIALTYYRPHYSGLTIYVERLARALAARGHRVTILTSRFAKHLPPHERLDGVEIVRPNVWFRLSKGVIMPSMPWWAWKLARQADVVNLHVPQFDAAYIALISRLLGKGVVLTYHCDLRLPRGWIHTLANRVSNLTNHITARAAHLIVHNTRDYAEHSPFLQRYLPKVLPLLPPVEVESVEPFQRHAFRQKYAIQPGQRLIGMAARLATEKGVEVLARALPLVLERFPQARVLFVGPYQDVLGEEDYARRVLSLIEPLREHWTFLGVVPPQDMAVFFHEIEVLALPSLNSTESFGLVQVEAMACGTPVVASDLPGVRVPVLHSGAGLIVPPQDSQALAQALIAILESPQRYRGQTENLVRATSPQVVAEEYERLFEWVRSGQPRHAHPLPYQQPETHL